MHLHINGQILLTSLTRPLHRNGFSWISCHHQKSAGTARAREGHRHTTETCSSINRDPRCCSNIFGLG